MPPPEQSRSKLTVRSMTLRSASIDREARTIEGVIATERQTTAFDLSTYRPVDEVVLMRGMELPDQMVLLDSHGVDAYYHPTVDDVRGSIRALQIERDKLVGTLHFAEDEASEMVWQKVEKGHVVNISAGIVPLETTTIPPNTTQRVAGKNYTAGSRPLLVRTRSAPREGSMVPFGADPTSTVRESTGQTPPNNRNEMMHATLRTFLEKLGLPEKATEKEAEAYFDGLTGPKQEMAATIRAHPKDDVPEAFLAAAAAAAAAATQAPVGDAGAGTDGQTTTARSGGNQTAENQAGGNDTTTPDPATIRTEGVQLERKRQTRIRELAGEDVGDELVARAISEGWDEARASQEFLVAIRGGRRPAVGSDAPAGHVRGHDQDCTARALGAAMMIRSGIDPVAGHVQFRDGMFVPRREGQDTTQLERAAEMGHPYHDYSLVDVCREACRIDGITIPSNRGAMIRAAVSGSTLTSIFTTSINAQVLGGYQDAADTTDGWTSSEDVPDFKTNERISMGKFGALKKLARGDTAEHLDESDSKEEYKIARYAGKFVIDEQDIIDDSMGALAQVSPSDMGNSAAQLRPNLVYGVLLANAALSDSVALFHNTHANYGTGNALAAATLQACIVAMAKQRIRTRPLNIKPRFLIVPQDLVFTASILLRSAERIISSASGGTYNPLMNLGIDLRSDDRIGVAGVTDPVTGTARAGTATNYYLAARPGENGAKTIVVGYLRGTGRAPAIRSYVLTEGQWGLGWDVKMDIGSKALDYRAMYKAAGV